ncbi:MAG: site-2 protease family protein [Dehalococcoidia bacterium]
MDVILHSVLPFFAMLVLLMIVHEWGHFITCKLANVKVLEFGLGLPPKLFGFKRGETEYTLNALPVGAFVRPAGEEDPEDPRGLMAQPHWIRLVILSAGALMNVFLAIFLFSLALMIPRTVDVSQARIGDVIPGSPADEAGLQPGDVIREVNGRDVESTQELSYLIRLHLGQTIDMMVLRPGETGASGDAGNILTVPVKARWSADPYTYTSAIAPSNSIAATDEAPIDLRVTTTEGFGESGILTLDAGSANEEHFEFYFKNSATLTLTERAVDGSIAQDHAANAPIEHDVAQGPTGISIGPAYTTTRALTDEEQAEVAAELPAGVELPTTRPVPFTETQWDAPWVAFPQGVVRSYESLILARNEIISKVKGGVGGSSGFQVTGPVGIAQLTGEVVEEAGWKSLMEFAALISMNLAVLNILPLPMLDGGRIVFVLIEIARRGKRIAPQREAMVHLAGLVAMLTFAAVITYFDLLRIFSGEGILR